MNPQICRAWVDFNDRPAQGGFAAISRRAFTSEIPGNGERVELYDGDGNTCQAKVMDVFDGFAVVEIDWDTWRDGEVA